MTTKREQQRTANGIFAVQTEQQTDRHTDLGIKAPNRSLKTTTTTTATKQRQYDCDLIVISLVSVPKLIKKYSLKTTCLGRVHNIILIRTINSTGQARAIY